MVTLAEVRMQIDELDKQLIQLLATRQRYVEQAVKTMPKPLLARTHETSHSNAP